ncbi:MAG: hypothetical protein V4858_06450 [Pseudomonadota bacterium]
MDSQYLQQQKLLLQKRVRRLGSCNARMFHSSFVQFWNYLVSHQLFGGVFSKLEAETALFAEQIEHVMKGEGIPYFDTEAEAAAFNYRLLKHCAMQPLNIGTGPELAVGIGLMRTVSVSEALNGFREAYLEPFYEYLDESLDQQATVLSMLLKYKRKVEWFEREQLAELAEKGERRLAEHLYAYLFDQGLNFHIEPQSASGEADLVAEELVLDAKIFDGAPTSRGVRYLKHGLNQLLTYTRDFHQSVGYLVIYRTCPEDLHFTFDRSDSLVPFVNFGGKTLYFLVVDICEHASSASKRGALRAHLVQEDELRILLEEAATGAPNLQTPIA